MCPRTWTNNPSTDHWWVQCWEFEGEHTGTVIEPRSTSSAELLSRPVLFWLRPHAVKTNAGFEGERPCWDGEVKYLAARCVSMGGKEHYVSVIVEKLGLLLCNLSFVFRASGNPQGTDLISNIKQASKALEVNKLDLVFQMAQMTIFLNNWKW